MTFHELRKSRGYHRIHNKGLPTAENPELEHKKSSEAGIVCWREFIAAGVEEIECQLAGPGSGKPWSYTKRFVANPPFMRNVQRTESWWLRWLGLEILEQQGFQTDTMSLMRMVTRFKEQLLQNFQHTRSSFKWMLQYVNYILIL